MVALMKYDRGLSEKLANVVVWRRDDFVNRSTEFFPRLSRVMQNPLTIPSRRVTRLPDGQAHPRREAARERRGVVRCRCQASSGNNAA